MAARCQACEAGIGVLPHGTGTKGNPFGVCSNCDSMTCGHHGHRDAHVPEFMCVECDPKLLAASAAVVAGGTVVTQKQGGTDLQTMLGGYRKHALPEDVWVVRSPSEFLQRRPGYDRGLLAEVESRQSKPGTYGWTDLAEDARVLLMMADMLTLKFAPQRPAREVPRPSP